MHDVRETMYARSVAVGEGLSGSLQADGVPAAGDVDLLAGATGSPASNGCR